MNGLEELYKHYAVNDVKFDPTRQVYVASKIVHSLQVNVSTSFVSSGNDKKVRVWVKDDDDEHDYVQSRTCT